jgi:hypothetical protein
VVREQHGVPQTAHGLKLYANLLGERAVFRPFSSGFPVWQQSIVSGHGSGILLKGGSLPGLTCCVVSEFQKGKHL